MAFLDAIGSILTGGATGIIGTVISGVAEYKKQEQKNRHDIAMQEAEREMIKMEIEGKERQVQIQADSAEQVAANNAFLESIHADRAAYARDSHSKYLVMVDVVRGLIRPVLTVGLCVLVAIIWWNTEAPELQNQIINTVLYITTAAVLWWFGTRVKAAK